MTQKSYKLINHTADIAIRVNKAISLFDFNKNKRTYLIGIISALSIVVFVSISCLFVMRASEKSKNKNFWMDENYALDVAVRQSSYLGLIVHGAHGQGSVAPFDYIFLKFLDQNKQRFNSFGLPDTIYYRLNSIFWDLVSGLTVVLAFFFSMRKKAGNYLIFIVQVLFLSMALYAYYFRHTNFYFATEMRPYALWNSLWFVIMALFLFYKEFKLPLVILLVLLAATVSASIYQLCSLAAGFVIIEVFDRKGFQNSFKKVSKYLIIPAVVSIYYVIIRDSQFRYVPDIQAFNQFQKEFFHFWLAKWRVPQFAVIGILMTFPFKEFRSHTVIFASILILYLIAPAINYITLTNGVFFTSRHYIYYDLAYPVFLISLALIIPSYLEKIRKRQLRVMDTT